MCTSITYRKKDCYFGRNMDVEASFQEGVMITPRNYKFELKNGNTYRNPYALIGMGLLIQGHPLYYEAANEKGLAMAGLNFPGNARYLEPKEGMDNIALFELLPWILGQAGTVKEARKLLERLNLTNISFMKELPSSPLHFMISDKEESIVAEPLETGLKIYDNPYDVMTNNPPFDYHLWNMNNYLNLSPANGENKFTDRYKLDNYGVGMGALGLPGDASSASRFVRAAFNLANSYSEDTETDNVTQFFHVLDSVAMVKGATLTDGGKYDITTYSCCINISRGIYYYKTYENNQINAIDMHKADLDGKDIYMFKLKKEQQIQYQN